MTQEAVARSNYRRRPERLDQNFPVLRHGWRAANTRTWHSYPSHSIRFGIHTVEEKVTKDRGLLA